MPKSKQFLGFSRQSYYLFSAFLLICLLIVYIWWPLVLDYIGYMDGRLPWYAYIDWLLLGLFFFMSISIMAYADIKVDGLIVMVGIFGGLVIESWGTQTNLWHYYTNERPPLWIIPAWPIASLSIDRITRVLNLLISWISKRIFRENVGQVLEKVLYWLIFLGFYLLMLWFVSPTLSKSYTVMALILCAVLILAPGDRRVAMLVFLSGSGLGYFLELWGTTRECWVYYTGQTLPVFAVFAHGMAAFAFYRTGQVIKSIWKSVRNRSLRFPDALA